MVEMNSDLSGKLLISMPDMTDPRFAQSVVYICSHSAEGAMGLIVNKPQPKIQFRNLLKQLDILAQTDTSEVRVHFGGPVEGTRGFVLHTSDYRSEMGTMDIDDSIGMTATLDVLEDIAGGTGPETSMLALGYSGWGPGQLESEIAENGWLTSESENDILFGRDNEQKWLAALKLLGIDPLMLSSSGGRA